MAGHYPVILNIEDRLCIVVGGGEVALRKVRALVEKGAVVRIIAPDAVVQIKEMVEKDEVEWEQRLYESGDLEGALLAVAATDDQQINREVRHEAYTRRVPVNIVDDPEGSDFHVPSFFEDGPLLVAVSTRGSSPAVARTLRRAIQEWMGPEFSRSLEIVGAFRERLKQEIHDPKERVRFWERGIDAEMIDLMREGDADKVKKALEDKLAEFSKNMR